jgi:hypothetical protein
LPGARAATVLGVTSGGPLAAAAEVGHLSFASLGSWGGVGGVLSGGATPEGVQQGGPEAAATGIDQDRLQQQLLQQHEQQPDDTGPGASLGSWGGVGGVWELSGSCHTPPAEMQQGVLAAVSHGTPQQQQQHEQQPDDTGPGSSLGSWGGVGGVWALSGSLAHEGLQQGVLETATGISQDRHQQQQQQQQQQQSPSMSGQGASLGSWGGATGTPQQGLQQLQRQQPGVTGHSTSLGSWGGVGGVWQLSGSLAPVEMEQAVQGQLKQHRQQA